MSAPSLGENAEGTGPMNRQGSIKLAFAMAIGVGVAGVAVGAKERSARAPTASLYVTKQCYACHGYAGQGGSAGPRLAGTAMGLRAFARQLRAPVADMPPYSPTILPDIELSQLFYYVQSIASKGRRLE